MNVIYVFRFCKHENKAKSHSQNFSISVKKSVFSKFMVLLNSLFSLDSPSLFEMKLESRFLPKVPFTERKTSLKNEKGGFRGLTVSIPISITISIPITIHDFFLF